MDNKNLIIAVLAVTAVVLFCTILLIQSSNYLGSGTGLRVAWADTVDRGGDYIVATGAFSDIDEAVYVLDGTVGQLNVYQYDNNRNRIVLYDSRDLGTYFESR